jgi:hypothetical protein
MPGVSHHNPTLVQVPALDRGDVLAGSLLRAITFAPEFSGTSVDPARGGI